MPSNTNELVIHRPDLEKGDWVIHPPGTTPAEIESGEASLLAAGPANWTGSGWDRPNQEDLRVAEMISEVA